MNVILTENYQELSEKAAQLIEKQVQADPQSILGLATGSTPLGTYQELIKGYKTRHIDYRDILTLNLDEYVGLDKNSIQSYHFFMKHKLFNKTGKCPFFFFFKGSPKTGCDYGDCLYIKKQENHPISIW